MNCPQSLDFWSSDWGQLKMHNATPSFFDQQAFRVNQNVTPSGSLYTP